MVFINIRDFGHNEAYRFFLLQVSFWATLCMSQLHQKMFDGRLFWVAMKHYLFKMFLKQVETIAKLCPVSFVTGYHAVEVVNCEDNLKTG